MPVRDALLCSAHGHIQGITKETFPGFVKIWWLCFPLCLRLVGLEEKNVNKHTQYVKVHGFMYVLCKVIPWNNFGFMCKSLLLIVWA